MKWYALVSLVALAVPAAALGKGPSQAKVEGPGLAAPLTFSLDGEAGGGPFGAFLASTGFLPAVFGQTPDPMLPGRPKGDLGARYTNRESAASRRLVALRRCRRGDRSRSGGSRPRRARRDAAPPPGPAGSRLVDTTIGPTMDLVGPIDLHHQATERVIGSYLIETEDGPALVDCGPSTCFQELKRELAEQGLAVPDVRHLLLTHIHLDHGGATGVLVREHPDLQVHVSPIGAPHLVDPSRLERSARRLYGETFDTLWGELAPVPAENVRAVGDRVLGLECFPSPGHASHHVCFLAPEGTLFSGDAAGVRIAPGRHVLPVAPPPDVDLEAWERTLAEIERRAPERLALPHFGVFDDPAEHLARTREELRRWAERVRLGATEDEFVRACRLDLEEAEGGDVGVWEKAGPLWQSYLGLRRYWDKRAAAGAAGATQAG